MPIVSPNNGNFDFAPDLLDFLAWRRELQTKLEPDGKGKEQFLASMDAHADMMMAELGIKDMTGARQRLEFGLLNMTRAKEQAHKTLVQILADAMRSS